MSKYIKTISESEYVKTVVNDKGEIVVCPNKYQEYIHNTIVDTELYTQEEFEKSMEIAVRMIEDDFKSGNGLWKNSVPLNCCQSKSIKDASPKKSSDRT